MNAPAVSRRGPSRVWADRGLPLTDPTNGAIEVLVVDDEHSLRESCASILRTEGFNVSVCGRGDEALDLLKRRRFDILLVDIYMNPISGLDILDAVHESWPETLVILMTGKPSVESNVQGLRSGAFDYLVKPFSASHLHVVIGSAAQAILAARAAAEQTSSDDAEEDRVAHSDTITLLGRSAAFHKVIELARKVASTNASVFLTGESGTGKEVIAQFIHTQSRRSDRALVAMNCAAMPEALLESEMFGHVAGAFTGATRDKEGLLEVAHMGTMFLDELTEMPLTVQAKLLRVLQDGVVRRVGSTKVDATVNVRFIAATNQDPGEAVAQGMLRKDLHFRLRVVPIHIPPLRERTDDIPVLAEHFLERFWKEHRAPGEPKPEFSAEAMESLRRRAWRGNVRELRNVVEHAVVMLEPDSVVQPEDLPSFAEPTVGETVYDASLAGETYHTARERVLRDFEQFYLRHIVREAHGNISDAARMADVDRTTLYRLMEKHGTERQNLLYD